MGPVYAPLDGSLKSIVDFVDFNAEHNATSPWLMFSSKESPDHISSISFHEMAVASHRAAHLLRPGREGPDQEIVMLLIDSDVPLYIAMITGIMRADWVPYPASPRNSADAICNMLQATSCRHVIFHAPSSELVSDVRRILVADGIEVEFKDLPSLHELFPELSPSHSPTTDRSVSPYPPSTLPDDSSRLVFYLHSSGSTGLPKSMPFTSLQSMEWFAGPWIINFRAVRFGLVGLPTYNLMGLAWQLCFPLHSVQCVATCSPQDPAPPIAPNSQSAYEATKLLGCTGIITTPPFIEAWSHSSEAIDYLRTLQIVIFAGGLLSTSVGDDLVSKGVILGSVYGGTAFASPTSPPLLSYPDRNWCWLRFNREEEKVDWIPQGDGTYELMIHETSSHHLSAYTGTNLKVYATKDLFVPHPMEKDLWKIVGRKDGVITLNNGEKIVPTQQEDCISGSPLVAGVVMFGNQQDQLGVLIEPSPSYVINPDDQGALAKFRNDLWDVVEMANEDAPEFARIFKEMITVTYCDKPLPRAGRGTVIRKQVQELYSKQINELYEAVHVSQQPGKTLLPNTWDTENIYAWLLQHARLVMARPDVDPSVNLFEQGLDSLAATFLRNRIIGALRSCEDATVSHAATFVPSDFIFEYPSIEQLTEATTNILEMSKDSERPAPRLTISVDDINDLVEKYHPTLPSPSSHVNSRSEDRHPVVLMTGATESVGSHILASLLADHRIGCIYTLLRESAEFQPREQLQAAFEDRGLPVESLDNSRLVVLVGDVAEPSLGLDSAQYSEMLGLVSHVVHNAWPVDFNLPLRSFEEHLTGVKCLVELCASVESPIKLLFASSIGVASRWDPSNGLVPEEALKDPEVATSNGYTASKYVAEKILEAASASNIHVTTVRIGQACGPRNTGAWEMNEWLPAMVKTSIALGCFPEMTGNVTWVPLDIIGHIYADWISSSRALPSIVNLVHPQPTSWDVIVKGVMDGLGEPLPVVPLNEWMREVDALSADAMIHELGNIPASQLMGGGSTMVQFDTSHFVASSLIVQNMQPISEEYATMWIKYWRKAGYIESYPVHE